MTAARSPELLGATDEEVDEWEMLAEAERGWEGGDWISSFPESFMAAFRNRMRQCLLGC